MLIVMTQDATEVQPNYTIDAVIEVADWTGQMLIKQGRAKAALIRVVHRKFPQWMVGQVVNSDMVVIDTVSGYDLPFVTDNPPLTDPQ
jgi:hypothetical protein